MRHRNVLLSAEIIVIVVAALAVWRVVVAGRPRLGPSSAPAQGNPSTIRTSSFGRFVGTWRVHGESLEIKSDRTGLQTWNAGPCHFNIDENEPMCTGTATVVFVETAAGVTGTLKTVAYSDRSGRVVTDRETTPDEMHSGQTFHLDTVDDGVLYWTYDPPIQGGNPYLCGPTASAAWRTKCNA
jgi:hypothetical protein